MKNLRRRTRTRKTGIGGLAVSACGLLAFAVALLAALLTPAFAQAAAGDLDRSFSGNGKVRTGFGSARASASSVAVDSKDRVVAAGWDDHSFALARYLGQA
jgi:hypothetical protein